MHYENTKIQGLDFSWSEVSEAVKNESLLSIDLEFSRLCNLKCIYCYAKAGKALENELTLKELKKIINDAIALGARNVVNIGGGEPLMYRHYWDIIEFERKCSLKTITFSNGTLINKNIAKKLYDYRENIALKFNSFNEDIQDELAGKKGTFKKIRAALDNLLEVGYASNSGPKLALETVVCKQNYHEIEKLYYFCRNNNILPYIEILTIQGTAKKFAKQLSISPVDAFQLFLKLQKYDKKINSIYWDLTPPIVGQTCKRMLYSAYITSVGNVQPCPGVEIASSDTNIRKHDLKWIIQNTEVFRKVRNIYNNLKGPCRSCEYSDCYGCRGTALFTTGDYLESDPTCWRISK